MPSPIHFYLDVSSPYGYFGAMLIEPLAAKHGRSVEWHPILLGAMFKSTGNQSLIQQPLKGPYSLHDFARSARFHGIPFNIPPVFPISGVAVGRAFLVLQEVSPTAAVAFLKDALTAFFVEGIDVSDANKAVTLAAQHGHAFGLSAAQIGDAMSTPAIKDALKAEVDGALAKGVFGSPFMIVDDEPFWGVDRLPQLDRWLTARF
jgi:2-hydroxychromene-2-carboxylate isomerase